MKRIQLIGIILFLMVNFAFAQNDISKAFSQSYTHEYNKEYDKAIVSLDKIYAADSYAINLRLGWLHYLGGNHAKSQSYYQNAIKLEKSSIEAQLGYVYPTSTLGNWDEVVKTYESILKLAPNHYTVNSRLAYIYFARKNFEKSNSYAAKVIKQYPFDYAINLLLGKINIGLGKINDAKKHLNKALLYSPKSKEVIELLKTL